MLKLHSISSIPDNVFPSQVSLVMGNGLDWVLQMSHVLLTAALGLDPLLSPGSYSKD